MYKIQKYRSIVNKSKVWFTTGSRKLQSNDSTNLERNYLRNIWTTWRHISTSKLTCQGLQTWSSFQTSALASFFFAYSFTDENTLVLDVLQLLFIANITFRSSKGSLLELYVVVGKRILRKGFEVTDLAILLLVRILQLVVIWLTDNFVFLFLALHYVVLGADELAGVTEALPSVRQVEGWGVAGTLGKYISKLMFSTS